jgi:hypothetical protein
MSFPLRLLAFVLLAAITSAAQTSPVPPSAPLVLFDGHSFDGLHVFVENNSVPVDGAWKIEEGILRCTGVGRGYVRTNHAYADYRLSVQWRWPKNPGNSGVLLHIVGADIIWPKCFEAQLAAGRAGDFASYSDARSKEEIVSHNPRGVSTGRLSKPGPSVEKPPGEWNTYDIVAQGDTVTLSVNGTQVNQMTRVIPSGGMIALQSEGSAVDFRNWTLTPLPPAKDLNAPMPAPAPKKAP